MPVSPAVGIQPPCAIEMQRTTSALGHQCCTAQSAQMGLDPRGERPLCIEQGLGLVDIGQRTIRIAFVDLVPR